MCIKCRGWVAKFGEELQPAFVDELRKSIRQRDMLILLKACQRLSIGLEHRPHGVEVLPTELCIDFAEAFDWILFQIEERDFKQLT